MPESSTLAPAHVEEIFQSLLRALEQKDYAAFITQGTERFRTGISQAMFRQVSQQLAPRMGQGYIAEFVSELKQCEHQLFLWKLSFSDGGSEFIARLVLTAENHVAGFMIN